MLIQFRQTAILSNSYIHWIRASISFAEPTIIDQNYLLPSQSQLLLHSLFSFSMWYFSETQYSSDLAYLVSHTLVSSTHFLNHSQSIQCNRSIDIIPNSITLTVIDASKIIIQVDRISCFVVHVAHVHTTWVVMFDRTETRPWSVFTVFIYLVTYYYA